MQFRHGDLLLEKVDSLPKGLKIKKDNVLLEGEITGHAHRVKTGAKVWQDKNGNVYMAVVTPTAPLTHEEHKTIEVPRGTYKITRQIESDPYGGVRNVRD